MRLRNHLVLAAFALLSVTAAIAAPPSTLVSKDEFVKEFAFDVGGSFWIDNPFGNIEIVGVDTPGLVVTVQKITRGVDQAALKEGREQTQIVLEGDNRVRSIRTVVPLVRTPRWSSQVSYVVRIPRTVHVKVLSQWSDHIHISNISGNVTVKNVSGAIRLDDIMGASIIDSINGKVTLEYSGRPAANAQITSVNGPIEVYVPGDANIEWLAQTLKGEYLTNLPMRGEFDGTVFRGVINAGGPTIATTAMTAPAFLLRRGTTTKTARSVNQVLASSATPAPRRVPLIHDTVQLPLVQGDWTFSTAVGNVRVGEIRGSAKIDTGAGDVELGTIYGTCNVTSLGGPLDLGEIYGWLIARTRAGDIVVHGAREGGIIATGGGIIQLFYNAGPTSLHSDGGDITVRQAAGAITADTHSGDISINADPNVKTLKVDAKAYQGNVLFNAGPHFAADIDATVMTSNSDSRAIYSDFTGLTIKRERVGDRTRIHATGKINGGGERVELFADEGDIHISNQLQAPITVVAPPK